MISSVYDLKNKVQDSTNSMLATFVSERQKNVSDMCVFAYI